MSVSSPSWGCGSVRQPEWIRECVMWVKWYTVHCISPHQLSQGAWHWHIKSKPPAFFWHLRTLALVLNMRTLVCRVTALFGTVISPEAAKPDSYFASVVFLLLITQHIFTSRCCWNACIAHRDPVSLLQDFMISSVSRTGKKLCVSYAQPVLFPWFHFQLGSKLVFQCWDLLVGLQLWEHVEAPWAGTSRRRRLASTRCGLISSWESNWLAHFLFTPSLNYQIQLVIWIIIHTGCFI